jgi:hypothetical protein
MHRYKNICTKKDEKLWRVEEKGEEEKKRKRGVGTWNWQVWPWRDGAGGG